MSTFAGFLVTNLKLWVIALIVCTVMMAVAGFVWQISSKTGENKNNWIMGISWGFAVLSAIMTLLTIISLIIKFT